MLLRVHSGRRPDTCAGRAVLLYTAPVNLCSARLFRNHVGLPDLSPSGQFQRHHAASKSTALILTIKGKPLLAGGDRNVDSTIMNFDRSEERRVGKECR